MKADPFQRTVVDIDALRENPRVSLCGMLVKVVTTFHDSPPDRLR